MYFRRYIISTSIKSGAEDRFPDIDNGMVALTDPFFSLTTLRQRPTSGLSSSAVAVDAQLQLGW